ncbi:CheY-like chemotaxis protein [Microlunatus panaciterrae]|uniref:CheY-like chemotaxis protein n=1 Tax=Microlunatus panaciterrae TaxID=400768 RepID=A0ABS2RKJ9_9ACTN|nr:response regulator [Microlunatus panaciterrae]MBM7798469.1 CheY-like chemotaxis protein [Microlunatus panaciterrae]
MTSRRVLVVDDDDSIREVAQMALELVGGWQVTTAACGAEGWAKAREHQPDAILMDVMMPGMDGPTTFSHMQDDPETREIPVILLTAKVQAGDRREFADLELAGVIAKPFDPMTLSNEVAELLGWQG